MSNNQEGQPPLSPLDWLKLKASQPPVSPESPRQPPPSPEPPPNPTQNRLPARARE
jgi:hypothetical protein